MAAVCVLLGRRAKPAEPAKQNCQLGGRIQAKSRLQVGLSVCLSGGLFVETQRPEGGGKSTDLRRPAEWLHCTVLAVVQHTGLCRVGLCAALQTRCGRSSHWLVPLLRPQLRAKQCSGVSIARPIRFFHPTDWTALPAPQVPSADCFRRFFSPNWRPLASQLDRQTNRQTDRRTERRRDRRRVSGIDLVSRAASFTLAADAICWPATLLWAGSLGQLVGPPDRQTGRQARGSWPASSGDQWATRTLATGDWRLATGGSRCPNGGHQIELVGAARASGAPKGELELQLELELELERRASLRARQRPVKFKQK